MKVLKTFLFICIALLIMGASCAPTLEDLPKDGSSLARLVCEAGECTLSSSEGIQSADWAYTALVFPEGCVFDDVVFCEQLFSESVTETSISKVPDDARVQVNFTTSSAFYELRNF